MVSRVGPTDGGRVAAGLAGRRQAVRAGAGRGGGGEPGECGKIKP